MTGDLRTYDKLVIGYSRVGGWAWAINYLKAGVKTPFMHIYGEGDILQTVSIGGESYNRCVMSVRQETKRVGVNIDKPEYPLHVVGDIYCTGKIITEKGIENRSS